MMQPDTGFPLSAAQRRIWQLELSGRPQRAVCMLRVSGTLETRALRGALVRVVERHEILRTGFRRRRGLKVPFQVIAEASAFAWHEVDLRPLAGPVSERQLRRLFDRAATWPIDLESGPVLAALLVTRSPRERILLLALPSLCADAESLHVLAQDIAACLGAEPEELGEPLQYVDFCDWQQEQLEAAPAAAPRSRRLPFEMPAAVPASRRQGGAEGLAVALGEDLRQRLRALAAAPGSGEANVLRAAWWSLLARHDDGGKTAVLEAFDGRDDEELASGIGSYAQWIPLQLRVDGSRRFSRLAQRLEGARSQAAEHRLIQAGLADGTDAGADASGGFGFEYQHWPPARTASGTILAALRRRVSARPMAAWLSALRTGPAAADLTVELCFDRAWLPRRDAARLADQLRRLLAAALAEPESELRRLPWLSAAEHRQLLSDADRPPPAAGSVHQRFESWAARTPEAPALVVGQQRLSYAELNRRANRLARALRHAGVAAEVPVVLYLERSAELIVAVLAVLKAGGAWVAADRSQPRDRLARLLGELPAAVVVSRAELAADLPPRPEAAILLDRDRDRIRRLGSADPAPAAGAHNLAYVVFTSGSTGRPKGVAVEHRQLLAYLDAVNARLGLAAGASYAHVTTLAADLGHTSLFGALCGGGCLHLIDRELATDPRALGEYLHQHAVDCLKIVPSHLEALGARSWPARFFPRKHLIVGGEAARREWVEELRQRAGGCRIWNHYGPSETTVGVTVCPAAGEADPRCATLPIGRPLASSRGLLLDARGEPVPTWVPGELHIGGAQLSRGYLGRPGRTAASFVPDPFSRRGGERLYRSGDRARRLPGGRLEFLGRRDRQVKLHGFRVELDEISDALRTHPQVDDAVVRRIADGYADVLVACYVSRQPVAPGQLRDRLAESLPREILPHHFVALERIPLTANGKVDERALPGLAEIRGSARTDFVAPRTETEKRLAEVWAQLLGMERVSVEESFFELGGHSLLATRLIARLSRVCGMDVRLPWIFDTPTVAGLARTLDAQAAPQRGAPHGAAPQRGPSAILRPLPADDPRRRVLSFAQQRLWFLQQLEPRSIAYNVPAALRLEGRLHPAALRRALCEVVRRHEVLRTTFPNPPGRPRPAIQPSSDIALPLVDLGGLGGRAPAVARRLARQAAARPFDLERGPLLRALLLRIGPAEHVLRLDLHHIVSDARTQEVLRRELAALYGSFAGGRPSPLPELPLQYADFAAWQRECLSDDASASLLAWWRRRLEGARPLQLPTDRPRPAVAGWRGGAHPCELAPALATALRELGRKAGASPYMTLLAAFLVLLARLTGQRDLVVGSPVANRSREELEGLIGCFVNLLPMRGDLAASSGSASRGPRRPPSFAELLGQVRETALGAFAHAELPFERLVEDLVPDRDLARHPLFQVTFALHGPAPARIELPGLVLSPQPPVVETVRVDLELHLWEVAGRPAGEGAPGDGVPGEAVPPGGMTGLFIYSRDLFDATTIARWWRCFDTLLAAIAADPERRLDELPVLPPAQRHQVTVEWNDTGSGSPAGGHLHRLFEQQAQRTPQREALLWGPPAPGEPGVREQLSGALSYRCLNRRANRLARRLRAAGVGPAAPVGLFLERGPEWVVAMLGILKAGGAYVPLDPSLPEIRLGALLADCGAVAVVSHRTMRSRLPAGGPAVICPEPGGGTPADDRNPDSGVGAAHPAYILFTSGSTGQPKGVVIPHAAICNHMRWMHAALPLHPDDRILQKTPTSFDASVWELWAPLQAGARLILAAPDEHRDPAALARAVRDHRVTILQVVPSLLRALLERPELGEAHRLRRLVCGGETLTGELSDRCAARLPRVELHNAYGPTEATIHASFGPGGRARPGAGVPIGRPITGVRVHLLDGCLRPVPMGVPGELCVAGAGLAQVLLGRRRLTAEAFSPDPLPSLPNTAGGERLYRTGDRARHLADGRLLFLGRRDRQVKIRGFRVEPGEIESILLRHETVREAAVVTLPESTPEGRRLVAYVVPEPQAATPQDARQAPGSAPNEAPSGPSRSPEPRWRRFLAARLPAAMVPAVFVTLEAMPRSHHGKVDRAALPAPDGSRPELETRFFAPRTARESRLADLWAEVLGVEQVGVHDNFFELGGHSLLVPELLLRIRERLGAAPTVKALFQAPTVAQLARALAEEEPARREPAPDLGADIALAPEIRAARPYPVSPPAAVFLTGATGFLGAHLLHELLQREDSQIHCLVRARRPRQGLERIRAQLRWLGLWRPGMEARIVAVPGDLTRPRLGLSEAAFGELSEQLEAIYHCAAWVNVTYPYEALQPSNVSGTHETLRLATRARYHFISTLSAAAPGADGVLREEAAGDGTAGLASGYAQSKWVAERLLELARRRGIAATVYRPSTIAGHSRGGPCNPRDLIWSLIKGCLQLQAAAPLAESFNLVPADYVSRGIVHIARQPGSAGGTFHLCNPRPFSWDAALDELSELGYPLRRLSFESWHRELLAQLEAGADNALRPFLPRLPQLAEAGARRPPRLDDREARRALATRGIDCPPMDGERFRAYVTSLVESGFLAAP